MRRAAVAGAAVDSWEKRGASQQLGRWGAALSSGDEVFADLASLSISRVGLRRHPACVRSFLSDSMREGGPNKLNCLLEIVGESAQCVRDLNRLSRESCHCRSMLARSPTQLVAVHLTLAGALHTYSSSRHGSVLQKRHPGFVNPQRA